ncbi:MAG: hypothetical protein FD129_2527, partial [bacterium]
DYPGVDSIPGDPGEDIVVYNWWSCATLEIPEAGRPSPWSGRRRILKPPLMLAQRTITIRCRNDCAP